MPARPGIDCAGLVGERAVLPHGPSGDGGPRFAEGVCLREGWIKVRVTGEERQRLEDGAAQHQAKTLSAFIRRAIDSAIIQKPLLTPAEIDQLDGTREQLRMAGVNLNALLREVHLFENGVSDRGPKLEDYRATLAELRQALGKVTDILRRYP